jgi:hypothetical protein
VRGAGFNAVALVAVEPDGNCVMGRRAF